MKQAPVSPTTTELKQQYKITPEAELAVLQASSEVSNLLQNPNEGLLAIVGGCAMTSDQSTIEAEGRRIADLGESLPELKILHRMPPWKPRTNPDDWHGEETTNPHGAYRTLVALAGSQSNVAIELASKQHLDRYGPMLTFGWIGGRNVGNQELVEAIARRDPKLPLGIKNGLDGDVIPALKRVAEVGKVRAGVESPAPAILIYRGGGDAKTPEAWEKAYLRALELSEGRIIVDVAHGSEMAHDPELNFQKSVAGQILAMQAVLRLAEQGYMPAGIMIEASDIESPTDPHMPLDTAIQGVKRLYELKMTHHDDRDRENNVIGVV